jgi:hypothetical protein
MGETVHPPTDAARVAIPTTHVLQAARADQADRHHQQVASVSSMERGVGTSLVRVCALASMAEAFTRAGALEDFSLQALASGKVGAAILPPVDAEQRIWTMQAVRCCRGRPAVLVDY